MLDQARDLIELARREGCSHLKVGEFEVAFQPAEVPNTHAIGFDLSPTVDTIDTEDRKR